MPETLAAARFDFEKLFTVPNAEPLPNDAPGDDRTDAGMMAREQSYRQADDLNWLLDGAESPEEESEADQAERMRKTPHAAYRGLQGP